MALDAPERTNRRPLAGARLSILLCRSIDAEGIADETLSSGTKNHPRAVPPSARLTATAPLRDETRD